MEMYLLKCEQIEKLNLNKQELERVFDYLTFEDIKIELENRGYGCITDERISMYCNTVLTKYDSSHLDDVIEFLENKGCLK